ncbi:hypothetical protein AC1031_015085 [Aphanomyces cochlioides]|nr:hypothetical protein AC1031_015085 [Aphanomyces cochlioides]
MSFEYADHFTPGHQVMIDRLIAAMGEADCTAMLAPLEPHQQLHLVEVIGRYGDMKLTTGVASSSEKIQDLEGQVANALRLKQLGEEPLRQQIANLEQQLRDTAVVRDTVEGSVGTDKHGGKSRHVKISVSDFGGAESHNAMRWLLKLSMASNAMDVQRDSVKIAFAMSHLKGRAEAWTRCV